MQRAGRFSHDCLTGDFPGVKRITVLCGSGNNGGDGYVVAALAQANGYATCVYALGEPKTPDATSARRHAEQQGCEIIECSGEPDLSDVISASELIVDAMLGTGVDRDIDDYLARVIGWINNARAPVLSCDMPTGLNSDTGAIMGACVMADVTTTFIALKAGLFTGQGKAVSGKIRYGGLGVSRKDMAPTPPQAKRISRASIAAIARPRSETAHKGSCGYAAILGGSPGMLGAVIMAGKAACRIGAGRVRVFTNPAHSEQLALFCPELLTRGCTGQDSLISELAGMDVVALGPGLGQDSWARGLFCQAMQAGKPMVIDADGLNILALDNDKCENRVLTPHPGEAARLLDCAVAEIERDRFAAAREIVDCFGGVCVLKGAGTLVAAADQLTRLCDRGNAGQATAGMGDVLTGVIAGLIAQGYSLFDSACLGVWLHASAADNVAASQGAIGMMASDLLPQIQILHNKILYEPETGP